MHQNGFIQLKQKTQELVRRVLGTNLELIPIDRIKNWQKGNQRCKSSMEHQNVTRLPDKRYNKMFDEIYIRNIIDYNQTRFIHNNKEESEKE